jgi:hypothetical protein
MGLVRLFIVQFSHVVTPVSVGGIMNGGTPEFVRSSNATLIFI